ncbi:putative C-4 methylsterol oxidase [Flammula alnicola]|nr:putative C-4 methylsterol oxidase [Flammula alnicola]
MSTFLGLWATIVSTYPHPLIEFFGSLLVQVIFFWIPCMIYMTLDYIAPSFSHRHKIQPIPKQPTRNDIVQCLHVVLRNQALAMAIHASLLALNYLSSKPSGYRITASPPKPLEFARDFILSIIIREILFYYVHRFFHHPTLYARIHKQHHRFIAPVSLAAQYASPVEHVFANIIPIALPGQLFRCHILTYWAFVAFELVETSTVHSGYDFFAGAARMHDKHHELFMVNFGALGFLDWIHGTNKLAQTRRSKVKDT